jgi:hypothetical protein
VNRILALAILLSVLPLFLPGRSIAQTAEPGFVELVVNDRPPLGVFPVVLDERERPYLQFDALMAALEVPASYDPSLQAALGFLADGTTRFELNLQRADVLVGDTHHALQPGQYLLRDQALFVLYSAVGEWIPVQIQWSKQAYQVRAVTAYPLPSGERGKREARRKALLQQRAEAPTAAQLEREAPWFDPGLFEFNATVRGGAENPDELVLNLKGVQRFLKGDLEYSVTGSRTDGETRDPRLDYGRLTYYDPLRTWQVQVGDTFSNFSPLLLDTQSLRGGSFYTGGQQLRFGRTTLIGTAPPGSEVDLIRQGVLLDFTVADAQGFYRFQNVPLTVDANLFEVTIYTPDGRRLSEFKQVAAQEEMLGAGALASLGAAGQGDQGTSRFNIGGGEVRYGLFPALTLGGYALRLRNYVAAYETIEDLNAAGAFVLGRPAEWLVLLGETARDRNAEGAGTRLGAFLAFQPVTLALERHAYTLDFAPPNRTRSTEFSQPDRADTIDSVLARTRAWGANIEARTTRSDFGESRRLSDNLLRLERRLTRNLSAFATFEQQRTHEAGYPGGGFDDQQVLATYRLATLERLEGFAQNRRALTGDDSAQLRASWLKNAQAGSPWSWELTYLTRHPLDDLGVAALGYLFPRNLRVSGRVQSDGAWLLQVDWSQPFRVTGEGVEALPAGMFGRAGVEGEVYVDANANGRRDAGETSAGDVQLLVPGISDMRSAADGRFRRWGMPAGAPIALDLDLLSADALLTPAEKHRYLTPRPGELVRLEIALVPSSGLDGVLRHAGGDPVSPAEGLQLVLRREDGGQVAQARVEWDGAFIFEHIPPGSYILEADAPAFAERGLALRPGQMRVDFPPSPDPAWLSGVTLELVREAR